MQNTKLVSLTGDRPTGNLHIGHYIGSLIQRLQFQNTHQSFIMIADAQAYTDHIHNRQKVKDSILQVLEDYIAVGLEPSKNTFFLQSAIPEIQELSFYLSNLVTVARVERIPTVRKEIFEKFTSEHKNFTDIPRDIPVGFLTYAISQSADILAFKADNVPVGPDQLPIIELTNEIVKTFNNTVSNNYFNNCTPVSNKDNGTLPGLDGKNKMSKTLGNTINLNATNDEIIKKVKTMYTDPNHLRVSDPGKVEGNTVFTYLDHFYKDTYHLDELKNKYRQGGLGDVMLKKLLSDCLIEIFEPIQKRRSTINKDELLFLLKNNTENARTVASSTVSEVKKLLGLSIF